MSPLGRNRSQTPRRGTPADLLVVGLGNPGSRYAGTRHNVGTEVVQTLVERHGGRLRSSKEQADVDVVRIGEARVALAIPHTYMNESGIAVGLLVRRHGITDPASLVISHDELDLPVGTFKLKLGGGLAGNNGLRSIQAHLKTTDFGRLRVGIGRPPSAQKGADYVLRPPSKAERTELDVVVEEAADAIEAIVGLGFAKAMNRYNTKNRSE